MNIEDINNYKQGYFRGKQMAKEGKSEQEALYSLTNEHQIEGVHCAYTEFLKEQFRDSLKLLYSSDRASIVDCVSSVVEVEALLHQRVQDATDFTIRKEEPWKYSVDKDGKHVYTLTKSQQGKWSCSCPGFGFRHKCKHVEALMESLNQSGQRLPQHLARVRQLEKSLSIWEGRLKDSPNDRVAQKNVELRKQALVEAKKKAEEIEALPKPTRHPREEFLGVIPSLDKLFKGLGDYEIVGSWRRGKDTYKDCDILTLMNKAQWSKLKERIENDPNFGPAPGHTHIDFGDDVIRGGYKNGDRVDYLDVNRVPDKENWGAWLLFRTGSAQFNIACRGWLKKFGCGLNEHGIKTPNGNINLPTEQAFFDAIGIPFIEPKDREDARKFYQEVRKLEKPEFL